MGLEDIMTLVVYPLSLSLLLGVSGLALQAFRSRSAGPSVVLFAVCWLVIWSIPAVADRIALSLEGRYQDLPVAAVPAADVILVFGGVMRPPRTSHPYPDLNAASDRVWQAARVYHAGKAPKIVVSGGRPDGQQALPSEAEAMGDLLVAFGVPRDALILEEESTTTRGNAVHCAKLMRERGFRRALLVTSALHMPRAAAALHATGVEFTPVATDFEVDGVARGVSAWFPDADALLRSTRALHEWTGMTVYRWRGWI